MPVTACSARPVNVVASGAVKTAPALYRAMPSVGATSQGQLQVSRRVHSDAAAQASVSAMSVWITLWQSTFGESGTTLGVILPRRQQTLWCVKTKLPAN